MLCDNEWIDSIGTPIPLPGYLVLADSRATKKGILDRLHWLVNDAKTSTRAAMAEGCDITTVQPRFLPSPVRSCSNACRRHCITKAMTGCRNWNARRSGRKRRCWRRRA